MQSLSFLDEFLKDDSISEIMINGISQIYIERKGQLYLSEAKFQNEEELNKVVFTILKPFGKQLSNNIPYIDTRLLDGSRVNIISSSVSLTGTMITIRKFSKKFLESTDLIAAGTLNNNMIVFLKYCAILKKNLIISGGTGSGKTTLLNVLSSFIPENERILTIEDTAELQLRQPHVGRLEAKQADVQGNGAVTIRQLLINSLRMRPDRIIIGECRGAEALDMLQAMNTGHKGSITTVHSNSTRDCCKRLEVMVMMANYDLSLKAIREQIAAGLNIVVQIDRLQDGTRKIINISEITGMEGDIITMSPLFEFKNGNHISTGILPSFIDELRSNNLNPEIFYNV